MWKDLLVSSPVWGPVGSWISLDQLDATLSPHRLVLGSVPTPNHNWKQFGPGAEPEPEMETETPSS